jgi:hypothetical protein
LAARCSAAVEIATKLLSYNGHEKLALGKKPR